MINEQKRVFFPLVLSKQKETVTEKNELVNGDNGDQCWTFFLNLGEIKNLNFSRWSPVRLSKTQAGKRRSLPVGFIQCC